jgi:hypothetical protein
MKLILSLAVLWLGTNLAGAERLVTSSPQPGHWVIVHETPSKDGRGELKPPDPNSPPWNRPTPLEGRMQRWNVRWEPKAATPPAKELKI